MPIEKTEDAPESVIEEKTAEKPKNEGLKVYQTKAPAEYAELLHKYADLYNVSADTMARVIECESGWDATIQSFHLRPDGSREQSYGLVQIYLPAHPYVTYEQAIDPEFAIEFMAKAFSEGRQSWWTCH